ncbi:MAG TPA: complex I subunit 1 family protein, partial [Anaeromyxobacteraceae bacterium]|nr:complex I subunit 1 family protein [Anaeromyxobacteraceae bacterium]
QSLRLEQMVQAQGQLLWGFLPALGFFLQPVGLLVFFASAFAETKRAPFDLPEGESEIVGYFIEYSGMKFGLMFLAEFAEIAVLSAIVTAVFLGGWHPLVVDTEWLRQHLVPLAFGGVCAGAFVAKMIVMMWLQLTVRWLLPRFRFDQIQKLCWKILLPAALVNIFVTGLALLLDPSMQLLAWIGVATLVAIAAVTAAAGRAPAPSAEHGHGSAHAAAGH